MATFTEYLLRMDPRDAIVAMVNEEGNNNTWFQRGQLEVSEPVNLGDRDTRVTISARRNATDADIDTVLPADSIEFEYRRLDIENYYNGALTGFYPPLPTSTQVLVEELARRTGHVFTVEDFIQEEIQNSNAANFQLKTKAESWRFIGSLPVNILDLEPIADVEIDSEAIALAATPVLRSFTSALPYLDGARFPISLASMDFTQEAQYNPALQNFIRNNFHHFSNLTIADTDDGSKSEWISQDNVLATFNMWDAVGEIVDLPNWHPTNPYYQKAIKITFHDPFRMFTDDPVVFVPVLEYHENKAVFSNDARLQMNGGLHGSDGTIINRYLNTLSVGHVLTMSESSQNFGAIDQLAGRAWGIFEDPSDLNLRQAVVMYNDKRLPHHGTSVSTNNENLTRAIVFALSPTYSTMFQGNFIVLYEPPVRSIATINDSQNEASYSQDILLYSLNGPDNAPYTAEVLNGQLAPGHSLTLTDPNGQYVIAGNSDLPGTYSFTLRVRNGLGDYTDYRYQYRNYEIPLRLYGNAPDAISGNPYAYQYTASGGYPPYAYAISAGTCPFAINPQTGRIAGTSTTPGPYTWTVVCEDSRGQRFFLDDALTVRTS